jgi:hypothetical protein
MDQQLSFWGPCVLVLTPSGVMVLLNKTSRFHPRHVVLKLTQADELVVVGVYGADGGSWHPETWRPALTMSVSGKTGSSRPTTKMTPRLTQSGKRAFLCDAWVILP